jgi:hypothetical protein
MMAWMSAEADKDKIGSVAQARKRSDAFSLIFFSRPTSSGKA